MLVLVWFVVNLVLAGWVAWDAARRHAFWPVWTALAFFGGIFGLGLWLAARRTRPVQVEHMGPLRSSLLALAGLPLFVLMFGTLSIVVTLLFEPVRMQGDSMAPTLQDQQFVIVEKVSYQFRDPRPGEIAALYYPLNPDKRFVKRIVGEEGDTIRIVDGHVYRNDVPVPDDYVPVDYRSHDDWGPQVIQQGYYFVMGDHRNNSADSRHWGFVPKKYFIGRAVGY